MRKIDNTIVYLCVQMMLDNEINHGAIYDHIVDIAFDLYEKFINSQEMTNKLLDICMKIREDKTDEYANFISEGLTDEIKKDEKLGSFMEAKVYALIPIIKTEILKYNYLE